MAKKGAILKRVAWIIALQVLVLLLTSLCFAQELSVEKLVAEKDIKTGDNVTVMLKFTNPFKQEIPIRIRDKNIIGSNGLDIQCLDYILPNQSEVTVAYEPLQAFSAGKFTLDKAEITYTNPATGKEESVKSNELEVDVKESKANLVAQGITTLYACNGQRIESRSFSSSGSSFSISFGNSGMSIQQQFNQQMQQIQQEMQERMQSAQQQMQNLLQNSQQNQDMNALKRAMQDEIAKQQEMRRQLQENLESNPQFKNITKSLQNQGYALKDKSVEATSNNSGSFQYTFTKPNETLTVRGEINESQLRNVEYIKEGGEEGRKENKDNDENKGFPWWIIALIAALVIAGYFIHKKLNKAEEEAKEEADGKEVIDYAAEARKMIEKAKELFSAGEEKEAYATVSRAVRFYFAHELGEKKELTNSETLKLLKKRKEFKAVRDCLNLCGLVEFAKYKPNKKDFSKITSLAESVIK